ncbi:MAG: VWA domain-containing protein, partial [Ignavibacteriaceae bacterium]|nr:VWA domain-containing protein [Ignavibacteriaceae bacterium]
MKKLLTIFAVFLFLFAVGCNKDDNPVNNDNTGDIPADPTNIAVPATVINNVTPTATFGKAATDPSRIQMNMTGLVNPVTNLPLSLVAQQNLFITEDGTVKGLKVTKVGSGATLKADIVFTIDISGSMGEEADSVASSIIKFAQKLQASGLDVQFACVGFYGNVDGAINFTNSTKLETYLNRSYGVYRAQGFSGTDSASLQNYALTFHGSHGTYAENGVVGILFANQYFSWRTGAQKIFINFTDESTQPSGLAQWSTSAICSQLGGAATVHTVWSGSADTANAYYWTPLQNERPWDMSKCTGGTVVLVPSNATGLDLSNLPVTGALSNSYLVEFKTSNATGTHNVIITIKEGTTADSKRVYT